MEKVEEVVNRGGVRVATFDMVSSQVLAHYRMIGESGSVSAVNEKLNVALR
jgi:hypothetical protein